MGGIHLLKMNNTEYRLFYCLALVTLLTSCQSGKQEKTNLKQWFYDNGQLKRYEEVDSHGVANGKYLFYERNGVLLDSGFLKNGEFVGIRKEYHPNGKLGALTQYYNGKVRHITFYDEKGFIELYYGYDYFDHLMFILHYDSGKPTSTEGDLVYNNIIPDTLIKGEPVKIVFLMAQPPDFKSELFLIRSSENGLQKDTQAYTVDQVNRIKASVTLEGMDSTLHILGISQSQKHSFSIRDTFDIDVAKIPKRQHLIENE